MRPDALLAGVLLAGFLILFIEALGFKWEASIAPLLSTGGGLVFALAIFLRALLSAPAAGAASATYDSSDLKAFSGFLFAIALVGLLGFKFGGALYVLGYALAIPGCRPRTAIFMAAPVLPVVHFLIELPLGLQLYQGLLFNWVE